MIEMWSARTSDALRSRRWGIGLYGHALDDRGRAAVEFVRGVAQTHMEVLYDPETFQLSLDGEEVGADDVELALNWGAGEGVLIEATTLGFAEVYLFCRALRSAGVAGPSILYAEPRQYNRPRHSHLLNRRDFELSEDVRQFSAIPGAAFMARSDRVTKGIFLLGYEGHRLQQALEQTDIRASQTSVLFGVPAFQAGWEMDAFANNVRTLREYQMEGDILFAGADNPKASFDAIDAVYSSCQTGERLLVGPIGTKPHGIGAAIFACEHPDVGLIYDHPQRRAGRSEQTARWHLFEVKA